MNNHFLKVLIADDEPVIREGVRDSVNWTSLQMEVVAEAEDGEEALDLALEHSVDILLADLNMPIMDGITLIKRVREQLPNCKIIIITGHDEFKYAQEAVRLNVVDYILKPVDPIQLRKVLERVRNELETTLKQKEYMQLASNQISKNMKLLREQFCLQWIEGRIDEFEIETQLAFLQLPTNLPKYMALIQAPEHLANKPLLKEKEKQMFEFSIKNIVSDLLYPFTNMIFRDDSGIVILLIWEEVSNILFEKVEQVIKEVLKTTIHLTVQELNSSISISEAYVRGKEALKNETTISPIVRRARQYIEDHFFEQTITLEMIAHTLQVSPVYLSRTIKQELGMSFVHLVTNMRMKKAIHLLNTTTLPIVEIAEQVGYDTQHYFSTSFKKVMGVSPNKYRKTMGLENE